MRQDLWVFSFVDWPNVYEISLLKYFSSGIVHVEVDLATDHSPDTRTGADPGVPWKNGLDLGKGGNQEVALILGKFHSYETILFFISQSTQFLKKI